jgi:hypothetical protein
MGSWKKYILEVIKNLKNADKANWHHRMAVRVSRTFDFPINRFYLRKLTPDRLHTLYTMTTKMLLLPPPLGVN